jgi:hypothetical protein
MWNAPLAHGILLTIATGGALVLFGLSVGLVIAAVGWVCIAMPTDLQAASPQESCASISDDEIEIVIELVHDALAGGDWTLCGDCYTRNLLQRLQLPLKEHIPAEWEQPASEPASTRRVDGGPHLAQNTPYPLKNGHKHSLRREPGASLGRLPTSTY